MGPITINDGAVFQVPSGDEDAPDSPDGALSLHLPSGSLRPSSDSDDYQGMVSALRAVGHPGGRLGNRALLLPYVLAPILNMRNM